MDEEKLIAIETRIAYQDQTIAELNDAVTAQQLKIDQLGALCEALVQRVRSLGDANAAAIAEDEPPPHY